MLVLPPDTYLTIPAANCKMIRNNDFLMAWNENAVEIEHREDLICSAYSSLLRLAGQRQVSLCVRLCLFYLCVCVVHWQAPRLSINYVYLCLRTCMCHGRGSSLSWSCKPCLVNVRSRRVAYSLHFDRQLGRAPLSIQVHIYPKACHVQLQEQNREIFSTLEYLIHGSVFLGKLVEVTICHTLL